MIKLSQTCLKIYENMSKVFKYKTNAVTGTAEWLVESEDYDFYQEIARYFFQNFWRAFVKILIFL